MKIGKLVVFMTAYVLSGVALGQANTASQIDLASNVVVSNSVVGTDPQGVAWAGNSTAYVVNDADDSLVRLDMSTTPPTITATFVFPSGFGPHAVAINPAGTRAIVAGDGTSVYIVNVATTPFSIVDTITVTADAGGIAYYNGGTRAIIVNEPNVLVVDTSTVPGAVTTVSLGTGNDGHAVAVNSAGTRAVVSLDAGGMLLLDLTTTPPSVRGSVAGTAGDPLGIAISPDGTRAIYVNEQSPASQAVVVDITGASPVVVGTVSLAILSPSAVAFNAVSGAALIAGDDGVVVLNPPYTSVAATIAHPNRRGASSYSLAINPAGTRAIVLHEDVLFCPYPVNVGNVVVGTTGTAVQTCTNAGSGPLTVTAITPSGPGFAVSGVPALPVVLPSGGTISFNVTFTPTSVGPQSGNVDVDVTFGGEGTGTFTSSFGTTGVGVLGAPITQVAVPTLSSTGLALLTLMLAAMGVFWGRRR